MPATDQLDFTTGTPVPGTLDVTWIHGATGEAPIQTHHYDEHTVILRQSKLTNYEGPFLYLLFGNDRALLLDTGATEDPVRFPLRSTVDGLIADWLRHHPRDNYELVVAHSHPHNDHVAGDGQFADRPTTTVVDGDLAGMRAYFGFQDWPAQTVQFDLGGRVLELLGTPGHHQAAIAVYDPWSGILLTGDTVYPGRLYVEDTAAFCDTLDRLVELAGSRAVTHILGCHIEMTHAPGRDYPIGASYQPRERALPMTPAQLVAVRDAAASIAQRPGVHRFDDVIIYNRPGKVDLRRALARAHLNNLLTTLRRRLHLL